MGETSIAGHIRRLEEDYELIAKKRPILQKKVHKPFVLKFPTYSYDFGSDISSNIGFPASSLVLKSKLHFFVAVPDVQLCLQLPEDVI